MDHILIIDDDTNINNLLREALEKGGYSCSQAYSGTEALLRLDMEPFDLVLLDLMLPGMSGERVLEEIRRKRDIPVIVLTAKGRLDDKVDLLKSGADDYVTKPFEIREVLARIEVQLRRRGTAEAAGNTLSHREMTLDKETFKVFVRGRELPRFTRQEFAILELLLSHPGRVYSKEEICVEADPRALRRVIQNLIKNGMDHGEKKIRIALKRQGDRAVMTFANQVSCPDKIDTEHVFDRFYKADEARSRTSTGLGLSIARELARRMEGDIAARMEEDWFVADVQLAALPCGAKGYTEDV